MRRDRDSALTGSAAGRCGDLGSRTSLDGAYVDVLAPGDADAWAGRSS